MAVGVNIVSQFDSKGIAKAIKDLKALEGVGAKSTYALRTFDKAMTNSLVTLAKFGTAVGVAAGVIGGKLVQAASSLEESQSKVDAVFGDSAQTIQDFAKTTATSLGITRQATLEAAGTFGNLIQAFGITRTDAASMSQNLVTLAADLASFNNVPIDQVFEALRSGLSGETEPLKRFGVALNDVRLKQEAMNMGLYNGKGVLDITAKTQAAYSLILKDTALAQGDIERTAGGFANQMRFLKASLSDAAAELGTMLLPYVKEFVKMLNERLVPYVERLVDVVGQEGLAGGLKMLGTSFLNAIEEGGKFTNMLLALSAVFVTVKLVAIAAAVAANLFGVALLTTPIGLVVAAVIAFGVALAALYLKFEPVRTVVNAIGQALIKTFQEIAEKVMNFFIIQINAVLVGINAMIWAANKLGADIEPIGYIALKSFGDAATAAEVAAKKMAAAQKVAGKPFEQLVGDYRGNMPKVKKVTEEITTSFGGAGKAVETAQQKLKKYIDAMKGLSSAQKAARDAAKGITKANNELAAANQRLADAQEYFRIVVGGYGAGSRQATDQQLELQKAQRRVERAGYGVEGAVFAVTRAEEELAALRLDPEASAQAIREAEISLAEAKLSVADATDSQTEATDELAAAEERLDEIINGAKEGSESYKDALDQLNDAKREQADATDAVTEAYERQREALDKLREAEEKLQEVRKGTSAAIQRRGNAMLNTPLDIAAPSASASGDGINAWDWDIYSGIIPFANGGVVTSPTVGLIGEAGPEAVIPLSDMSAMGGMNIVVNINAGMGTDPAALGDEIVNVLQRYNRRNGALPLKVA